MTLAVEILIAVLVLAGAIFVLVTGVTMFRARDALGRINVLGPATAIGVPCLVTAHWLQNLLTDGFSLWALIRAIITILALLVVSSVASNVLARATYLTGTPTDPQTSPNDLVDDPPAGEDGAGS